MSAGTNGTNTVKINTLTNYNSTIRRIESGEIITLINGIDGKIGNSAGDGIKSGSTAKITTLHNAGGENGVVYISGGEVTMLNNGVWTSGVTVDTSIHKQDTNGNWTLTESTLEHKSIKGVVVMDGGKVTTLNQIYEGSKATISGSADIITLNMLQDSSTNYCLGCELNLNGTVTTLNYGVGTVNFNGGSVTTLNNTGTELSISNDATITTLENKGTVTISGSVSGEVKNTGAMSFLPKMLTRMPWDRLREISQTAAR